MTTSKLNVKLFADGADAGVIAELAKNEMISGFTTNPTLMRKANVTDYRAFAGEVLQIVPDRSVSFEVFSDEFDEMEEQAHEIASWGPNVYVKIPVTNTRGEFSGSLVKRLSAAGVQVNVTAIMTMHQVQRVCACLAPHTASYVSVFAGRIADAGRDPVPVMRESVNILSSLPKAELIWASPRELYNVVQADEVGCHIITATNDILKKLPLLGKNLDEYSLETVAMFYRDATAAGFQIETSRQRQMAA